MLKKLKRNEQTRKMNVGWCGQRTEKNKSPKLKFH